MTTEVWIVMIFGGILILGGLIGRLTWVMRGVALFVGAGLILVGTIGPENIKYLSISKDGLQIVSRHEPSDKERALALNFSQENPSSEDLKEGQEFIKKAKDRAPEERSPEDYLALATEKWRAKQYDAALADVFAGLALNPENIRIKATLIHRKASIYHYSRSKDLGIRFYKEAMEVDPAFSSPYNNLGVLYSDQGKLEEAKKEYEEALRLDPGNDRTKTNLNILKNEIEMKMRQ